VRIDRMARCQRPKTLRSPAQRRRTGQRARAAAPCSPWRAAHPIVGPTSSCSLPTHPRQRGLRLARRATRLLAIVLIPTRGAPDGGVAGKFRERRNRRSDGAARLARGRYGCSDRTAPLLARGTRTRKSRSRHVLHIHSVAMVVLALLSLSTHWCFRWRWGLAGAAALSRGGDALRLPVGGALVLLAFFRRTAIG